MKKLTKKNWLHEADTLSLTADYAELETLLAAAPAAVRDTTEYRLVTALHCAAVARLVPRAAVMVALT